MKSGTNLNELQKLTEELQQMMQKDLNDKLFYLVTNFDPDHEPDEFLHAIKIAVSQGANIYMRDADGRSLLEYANDPVLKDVLINIVLEKEVSAILDDITLVEKEEAEQIKRMLKDEGIFYEEKGERISAQPADQAPLPRDPMFEEIDKAFKQADLKEKQRQDRIEAQARINMERQRLAAEQAKQAEINARVKQLNRELKHELTPASAGAIMTCLMLLTKDQIPQSTREAIQGNFQNIFAAYNQKLKMERMKLSVYQHITSNLSNPNNPSAAAYFYQAANAPTRTSSIGKFSGNSSAKNFQQFEEILKPMVNSLVESLKDQRSASDSTLVAMESVNLALQCIEGPKVKDSFTTFMPMVKDQIDIAMNTVTTNADKKFLDVLDRIIDKINSGDPIAKNIEALKKEISAIQTPRASK